MSDSANDALEFYINGCAIILIAILGNLGNFVCISLLQCRNSKLNPTFSNLITWLAVIDSVFLIFLALTFSLPCLSEEYKKWIFPALLPTSLPLTSIALTASLYMVVAASIERYLQLTQPRHSDKGSFLGYVLPVVIFSAIYNIPKFFEFYTTYSGSDSLPSLQVSEFRKNSDYSKYVLGSNFVFMGLLPFTVLIVLNFCIYKRMHSPSAAHQYESTKMGALLFTIVLVQLLSHLPRTALNFYEIYMTLFIGDVTLSQPWLVDISHLSLALASSSNVAILAAQDLKFRAVLVSDIKGVITRYRLISSSEQRDSSII